MHRKVTFRMYPTPAETAALERTLTAHCKVYNTLLETARLRHKAGLPAFNRTSVNAAVKQIRDTHGWIAERTTAQSIQATGERLVKAFDAFFRRIAEGKTAGYPRFKSVQRYPGWGYKQHADGWKLLGRTIRVQRGEVKAHGYRAVRLTGIGSISIRGRGRYDGEPKTAEVTRKGDKWYLSVTFEVDAAQLQRKSGSAVTAFDWGLGTLLTQVIGDPMTGAVEEVDNPRWLKAQLSKLAQTQQLIATLEAAAKKRSGKDRAFPVSAQLRQVYERRRKLHAKVAAQRHDFYHQLSARLVARFGLIVTEELAVANMSRAPKPRPDAANDGQYLPNGASAKAGLNRSILDAAPAGFITKLRYKAEEAGSKFIEVPTRAVKPTQRCHVCGETTKLELKDRRWTCACGARHERDENAARTMLRYELEGQWWEQKHGAGTARSAARRA